MARLQRSFPVLLALLLGLPFLFDPFGLFELNAGSYYGVNAKNWERLGFAELRGAQVGPGLYASGAQPLPLLHHPPGGPWILCLGSSAEWRLRLPPILAHALAVWLLFGAVARVHGQRAALLSAFFLALVPVLAVQTQSSLETLVIAAGILLLEIDARTRLAPPSGRTQMQRAVLLLVALLGPWIDWFFAFFAAALLVPHAGEPLRLALRRAALPVLVSACSCCGVFAWKAWALSAPIFSGASAGLDTWSLVENVILERRPLGPLLEAVGLRLLEAATPFLGAAGLLGVLWMLSRAPREILRWLLPGALVIAIFAEHSATHVHFVSMLVPALCVAAGVLLGAGGRAIVPRRALAMAIALGLLLCTLEQRFAGRTDYFQELGRTLVQSTRSDSGEGLARPCFVATNAAGRMPYYIDTPYFWPLPVSKVEELEPALGALDGSTGARFLYLDIAASSWSAEPAPPDRGDLRRFLERFPHEPLPQLERSFRCRSLGTRIEIRTAWLVQLAP
ncbi:MAG: glycosyltransferase family 39 protein [Planctomycetes bacterium]|nr:glycosyltransferase family 39 protein [Planctomycetota bacterium]